MLRLDEMGGDYLDGDGRSLPPSGALFAAPVPRLEDLHFESFRFPAHYLADLEFSYVADFESSSFELVRFEDFKPSLFPVELHTLSKTLALSVKNCDGDSRVNTAIRYSLSPEQRAQILFAEGQNSPLASS